MALDIYFSTTKKSFQDCRSIHFWNFFLSISVLRPIRTMKQFSFINDLIVFSESPVSSQASLTDIRILSLFASGCVFFRNIYNRSISAGRWYWPFLLPILSSPKVLILWAFSLNITSQNRTKGVWHSSYPVLNSHKRVSLIKRPGNGGFLRL